MAKGKRAGSGTGARLRLPTPDAPPTDYARFTKDLWGDLDGWNNFWVARWQRVMDFLRSQHWRMLQVLDESQIPEWKRFPVTNFSLAMYSDLLKEWLQSKVRYSAVPDSADPEDIAQADLADYTLKYLWDNCEMDEVKIDVGAWLMSTGNADARVRWDTNTGELAPLVEIVDGQEVPINPETGQPDPSMQEPISVPTGDIMVDVISPQMARWAMSKAHGCMIGYLLSYDEVAQRHGPEVADGLSYTGAIGGSLTLDLLNPAVPFNPEQRANKSLVKEHYLPRSNLHRQGLWWICSGNTMITEPKPLPGGVIPVVHFRWIPFPGHPTFGLSPMYDLTYTNKLYEEMQARSLEWAAKVMPKTLLKQGGGISPGDMTDEPAQELLVPEGLEPEPFSVMEPPNIFINTRNEAREDLLVVGGYRFSRSKEIPPGESMNRFRRAPEMINDGEQAALAQICSKTAWQRLGYAMIGFATEFYPDGKIMGISGPNATYEWRELKKSQIKDIRAKLRVDELPLYQWNRQSMKDNVIALFSTGAAEILFAGADGQMDKDRIQAAIEAVGLDASIPMTDPDVMEARNELHIFRNLPEDATPPEATPWQNHEEHLAIKTREIKGLGFKGWPEHASKALMENIAGHEQAISQAESQQSEGMLEQEQALRQIRATVETQQDVRTALGEALIEVIKGTMAEMLDVGEPTKREE